MKIPESKSASQKTLSIKLNLTFDDVTDNRIPDATAYIYDKSGRFIASEPLPGKDSVAIKIDIPKKYLGSHVRVFIGPAKHYEESEFNQLMRQASPHDKKRAGSTIASMRKKSFLERILLVDKTTVKLSDTIYKDYWQKWLKCKCLVRGRFVKPITLPDGTTQYLGLSNACVCLHEVDSIPYVISKLPEKDLYRLRDDLLVYLEEKIPFPPDPWPPVFVKEPPIPGPFLVKTVTADRKAVAVKGLQPARHSLLSARHETIAGEPKAKIDTAPLKADLQSIFTATSETRLRQALIANATIVKNIACSLKWIFGYLKKDFIKCTTTDAFGYFETVIYYSCFGDKPDLYFQACQCIGGVPHMVYDPGVACHTHWNYECGTELTLEVTDPAAIVTAEPDPVDPPPGVTSWVMPYAIGNMRLDRIKSNGLVDYDSIIDAPFGGYLRFRHGFSENIPSNDLYYYRWLYQKDGDSNWTEFDLPVIRHYVREELGKLPTFPIVTLGPKVVNSKNLYRFKPADPDLCDDVIPGGNNYWPAEDWFYETYTGFLNSPTLPGGVANAHGVYTLKLEVYDSGGNRVDPASSTFDFIVPDGLDTDGVTIKSRLPISSEIDDKGFIFTLHVDNRPTTSTIDAPHIGSTVASDDCGFLRYNPGDNVTLSFHANQDNNFAMLSYWIKRGANTILGHYWQEVSSNPLGVFAGDGNGNFSHNFPNAVLRDTCTSAAFAEILRTYAKATNGKRRLHEYDSHDEWAFALAPEEES
ncbi:MAG: hypothetical protein U9N60_07195 [Thermodesulfobacteriota bacterium]|nr:hypothetical protein [Thermodesulfobacteriota bacterium]